MLNLTDVINIILKITEILEKSVDLVSYRVFRKYRWICEKLVKGIMMHLKISF